MGRWRRCGEVAAWEGARTGSSSGVGGAGTTGGGHNCCGEVAARGEEDVGAARMGRTSGASGGCVGGGGCRRSR